MNFTKPIDIPRSTHYGNNYFAVYSNKIHRICHFYSNLEYYNFLSLEINPKVSSFCEQPVKGIYACVGANRLKMATIIRKSERCFAKMQAQPEW